MAETDGFQAEPKEKKRRGYTAVEAIDPRDGKKWEVLLPDRAMKYVAGRGMGATMELADTVRWTLRYPKAIFRGVRDDQKDLDEDGWLCYVSTPTHAYDYKTGESRPPWDGEVFMVFVTNERVIYTWQWCNSDSRDPQLPDDHENRFSEKLI